MKHKLTDEGKERLPDFVKFGKHMLKSMDIDPLYPVLKHLQQGMSKPKKLWHSFLYVAWYNLPSATAAFDLCPDPKKARDLLELLDSSWPTGIERRANRGGKVKEHILSFIHSFEDAGGIDAWHWADMLAPYPTSDSTLIMRNNNWRVMNERIQTVHLNGRWAAYKHCEVLRRVNGMELEAPDMGNQFSSGPREGLSLFYGEIEGQKKEVIEILDQQGLDLQRRVEKRGLEVDIEELETLLCNWKSLYKGKYYVGHDIDEFQEQITVSNEKGIISAKQAQRLFEARYATLPVQYLGEANDWYEVSKTRKKAYKERGKIVIRKAA